MGHTWMPVDEIKTKQTIKTNHHTVTQERITSATVGRVLARIAKCIYLPHDLVYILTNPVT